MSISPDDIQLAQTGDEQAIERILRGTRKLISHVIRQRCYSHTYLWDDLHQEGSLGVLRAIQTYDERCPFVVWATINIHGAMVNFIARWKRHEFIKLEPTAGGYRKLLPPGRRWVCYTCGNRSEKLDKGLCLACVRALYRARAQAGGTGICPVHRRIIRSRNLRPWCPECGYDVEPW